MTLELIAFGDRVDPRLAQFPGISVRGETLMQRVTALYSGSNKNVWLEQLTPRDFALQFRKGDEVYWFKCNGSGDLEIRECEIHHPDKLINTKSSQLSLHRLNTYEFDSSSKVIRRVSHTGYFNTTYQSLLVSEPVLRTLVERAYSSAHPSI